MASIPNYYFFFLFFSPTLFFVREENSGARGLSGLGMFLSCWGGVSVASVCPSYLLLLEREEEEEEEEEEVEPRFSPLSLSLAFSSFPRG